MGGGGRKERREAYWRDAGTEAQDCRCAGPGPGGRRRWHMAIRFPGRPASRPPRRSTHHAKVEEQEECVEAVPAAVDEGGVPVLEQVAGQVPAAQVDAVQGRPLGPPAVWQGVQRGERER